MAICRSTSRTFCPWFPPSRDGVVVAGTVVVPVKAMGAVEHFAYVFVGLQAGVAAVAHQGTVGVVVVHLLHIAVCVGHYAVVA